MTKVLIATVKPFAKAAVEQIKSTLDEAGYESVFFEKYASQDDFVGAVADADGGI